ncbi:conserved exported hypothetical protein [Candidatus Competibacter denitrificans Run_A_D11]|uniref:TIGR03751 family conjugal transfer lipoprotein n=1 Tax=Candidatus Competibacter denitrificans Run_A_D11 TaxID=1400863 RepID=W6MEK7_9GAMM|nr:hypothetical protein [Candidatus Competibacter denitrificans]CDI04783.1 conserved exported hypothetical protein [Candidatus Competibacter denitrificans Run_A_D11]HRZ06321.1 hypothetical protein [Candidatus Competibacteraceae bacterium]HSA45519.1 hypothetical protein [Candidatus Competibacteraceae bacterium]
MPRSIDSFDRLGSVPRVTPRLRVLTLTLALTLGLSSCASGPSEKDRLPDEGPTTLQIYEQHLGGEIARSVAATSGPLASAEIAAPPIPGEPISPLMTAPSRRSHQELTALQDDFQRLPNPEILGYVYPHRAGDLPVPGYYTVFPLREGTSYAEPGEGEYAGSVP